MPDTVPDTIVVESQSPAPIPSPLPESWTDAQPRDPPSVWYPPPRTPPNTPEPSTPVPRPDDKVGVPEANKAEESDVGDSASVVPPAPEPSKRDPSYWKLLDYMYHISIAIISYLFWDFTCYTFPPCQSQLQG